MKRKYIVGLFDILGFESRLLQIGLDEIISKYEALISLVNYRQDQENRVFVDLGFNEDIYWCAGNELFVFNKIYGAYSSDSILIWADYSWLEARGKTDDEIAKLSESPTDGWKYYPVPCDNFLDVCNDLVCKALELDLPLRGAISVGEAVLDKDKGVFVGMPIVEAARMEKGQKFVGVSFCESALKQVIPKRYLLDFSSHIKKDYQYSSSQVVLDWPRHWRDTRAGNISDFLKNMSKDKTSHVLDIYKTTEDFCLKSLGNSELYKDHEHVSIRCVYPQLSFDNDQLRARARAIRRIPV